MLSIFFRIRSLLWTCLLLVTYFCHSGFASTSASTAAATTKTIESSPSSPSLSLPSPSIITRYIPRVGPRKSRLTWINGIGYNIEDMEKAQKEISKIFGGKRVEFCHNPTAMKHGEDYKGYLGDLTQAGTQKLGKITQEVDNLVQHLKDAVAAVGQEGRVIHIAHSQGALITYLAAKQLQPNELRQIEIIAFGGAAVLQKSKQLPFHRCTNYYSINDPLLFIVPQAEQALRSGLFIDEFCFLTPRVGDPISDHELLGATYGEALTWEGNRFQRKYQTLHYRLIRTAVLFFISIVQSMDTKVHHLAKPIATWLLLCWMWLRKQCLVLHYWIQRCLIMPFAVLMATFFQWIQHVIQSWKGVEDEKYVPVTKNTNN